MIGPSTFIQREQEHEIEAIRAALIEGEASGEARPFDAVAFKQRMTEYHLTLLAERDLETIRAYTLGS